MLEKGEAVFAKLEGVRDPRWLPESAFVWASTITDESQRERAIHSVFEKWTEGGPTRADGLELRSDAQRMACPTG